MTDDRFELPAEEMSLQDRQILEVVHEAGCAIFTDTIPQLVAASSSLNHESLKAKLWSAFISCASGAMEAELGHKRKTELLLRLAEHAPQEPATHQVH